MDAGPVLRRGGGEKTAGGCPGQLSALRQPRGRDEQHENGEEPVEAGPSPFFIGSREEACRPLPFSLLARCSGVSC